MDKKYEYNTEDINDFLLQISDDVIFINIKEQIENSTSTEENYFSFILDKLEGLKAVLGEEQVELRHRIDAFKDEVCDSVQEMLESKYGFTCDFKCYSDRSKCLKEIYKFFVIRKKEILLNLVNNYIDNEYKSLVMKYGKNKINKKDISYINNKKTIDKEDMSILLNIHNIITLIEIDSIEDMLDMLIEDRDEFTYNFIYTMFQQEEIVFKIDFLNIIKSEIVKEKNYIIMESRLKLMDRLKKN